MKKLTSYKKVNLPPKAKKKMKASYLRRITKIIFWILILLISIYTAFRYGLIPNHLLNQAYAVADYLEKETPLPMMSFSKDKADDIDETQKEKGADNASLSGYEFEYKYWALNYGAPDVPAETDFLETNKESAPNGNAVKPKVTPSVKPTIKPSVDQSKAKIGIMPAKGKIGSAFGSRMHPIKGTIEPHKGIDIEAQSGDRIVAFLSGEVIYAGFESTFGNYIKIQHSNGLLTLYAHCSKIIAKKGQKVAAGELIAHVGNTGSSLGPHLHFEVHQNGVPVNPMMFIK